MTLPEGPSEEPQPGQEAPATPPGQQRSPYWRPPVSPTGAGRLVTAALAGTIGVLLVLTATSVAIVVNRERWTTTSGSELMPFVIGWLAGVGFAMVGLGILTGIAWMVWQHRAHANRAALAADALKPSVVWWWLVPVAGLFMPFLAIRDLVKSGHDRPGLRNWWWASYLAFGVVSGLAAILPLYLADGAWQEGIAIVGYLLGIVAALLAIRVVRLIEAGLEASRQKQGWPVGWKRVGGGTQFLFAIGSAAVASIGALLMGIVLPDLLDGIARAEAGATAASAFSAGTCFNYSEDGYPEVSCRDPHEAEVYAELTHPDQAVYPGPEEIESWAEPLCYVRFERYTGVRYEESSLDFGYLYPGSQGWAAGDHKVICYLFDPAGNDLTEPIETGSVPA